MQASDPATTEARHKQHEEIKAEVEKRLVANADNFDKAILTYSSAGLALSLGFLKDFVPIAEATSAWLLYGSWVSFLLAVITTLLSYLTSQGAQRRQLDISVKYNLELKDDALTEVNWQQRLTELGSYVAGACFGIALIGSTLFVALNLHKGPKMPTTIRGIAQDGAPAPLLQKIQGSTLEKKGAPVPVIPTIPQPQPVTDPATAPAATPASGSK